MSGLTLLCAATAIEAQACRRGIKDSDLEKSFEICLTGMGMDSAADALTKRLNSKKLPSPARVISTGFAGGSDPRLAVGSWVLGRSIGDGASKLELDWRAFELGLATTNLSWSAVEVTSIEKVNSFEQPVFQIQMAVDMESFSLAQVAGRKGIDFQIFRLISDNPNEPLPAAIASFAGKKIFEGLCSVTKQPLPFARFLMRASRLPKTLSHGWKTAAPALVALR